MDFYGDIVYPHVNRTEQYGTFWQHMAYLWLRRIKPQGLHVLSEAFSMQYSAGINKRKCTVIQQI